MTRFLPGRRLWQIAIALLLIVVLALAGYIGYQKAFHKSYTAYFTEVNNLYPGDPIKVLGVDVGTVSSVTPRAGDVKVRFDVDRDVDVPRTASAVIVAQSLVSGRFIQLSPVYAGGPQLASGSDIPMSRTARQARSNCSSTLFSSSPCRRPPAHCTTCGKSSTSPRVWPPTRWCSSRSSMRG